MINQEMLKVIKWLGTGVLILGTAVNGLGHWPEGPLLLALGGVLWLMAGVAQKDLPLVITNAVMTLVGVATVLYSLYGPLTDQPLEGSAKADGYYSVDKD